MKNVSIKDESVKYFLSINNLKVIWEKIRQTFASKDSYDKLSARLDRLENAIVDMGSLINVASLDDIANLQRQINELHAELNKK